MTLILLTHNAILGPDCHHPVRKYGGNHTLDECISWAEVMEIDSFRMARLPISYFPDNSYEDIGRRCR